MACKECGGLGFIGNVGDPNITLKECDCERWRRIAASMDPYIRKAAFKEEHLTHTLVDMIGESCFVIGSWSDLKAIIKVTIIKYWPKVIKITSDREIRDVFVGSKSKQSHSDEFDGKVYNNLEDLMDSPDLVVVRLGELNYNNKAASGALEEALSYRFDRAKPTWAVSNIDRPFTQGSIAYSDSVMELLHSACKQVLIKRVFPRVTVENSILSPDVEQTANPQPQSTNPTPIHIRKPEFRPRIQSAPDVDDFNPLGIGQGSTKSRKFKGRE